MHTKVQGLILIIFLLSCTSEQPPSALLGRFNLDKDLYLAQFDCKTDVDDLYSVAGVATILSDSRFKNVKYHAVAGAYGIQEGLYVPANELFEAAFGRNWSDAHSNFEHALKEVTRIATNTLERGGDIWIADAGQSDFSAALIRNIKSTFPKIETKSHINVVQHSDWNESATAAENVSYVKANASYHKIPDGNIVGNGSPGFKTDKNVNWQGYITNPEITHVWELAIKIANKYNGKQNRYKNSDIAHGGMDFSDVSETCWIFGFESLINVEQFFQEFSDSSNSSSEVDKNLAVANEFIDAFYSFNSDRLDSVLVYAQESKNSILYYQGWAEGGNYEVIERHLCVVNNDSLVICPVTVKDDLIGALEIDFNVTDTFHLKVINGRLLSVTTSSNDPSLFHEAYEWAIENHPELMEGPCSGMWEGGPTPDDCCRAMVKAYAEFLAIKKFNTKNN